MSSTTTLAHSTSLPAKPVSSGLTPTATTAKCTQCRKDESKYTCPRCSTRTCSLACSKTHKSQSGCTGERDRTVYVPLNAYTHGKLMDDYVYLEDVGRKVGEWGEEIVRGGYAQTPVVNGNMGAGMRGSGVRGRGGRGRGRGGQHGHHNGNSKRDALKMQLEMRDIDVDLLPLGMERRKANQSTWDGKNQTALLTIEFLLHKPKDPFAPSSQERGPPLRMITHRNDTKKTLLTLLRERMVEKSRGKNVKQEGALPLWTKALVFPDDDDPESFVLPQCVMATRLDPLAFQRLQNGQVKAKRACYALKVDEPLEQALKYTQFVEFPTIEVWEEFEGTIVDAQGTVTREEQRPAKRRKLNEKAGREAMKGMLGGYGSSEEEEEGEDGKDAIGVLGDYESEEELVFSDEEGEKEIDAAGLLELVRKSRGWNEDAVDWGESEEEG